jgi:hypothetical protein
LRQALTVEAAPFAAGAVDCWGHFSGLQEFSDLGEGGDRHLPQFLGNFDQLSLMRLGVIDITVGDGLSCHLLQTQRLGAYLKFVVVELAAMATLVLHGIPASVVFFYQVCLANQPVALRLEPDCPHLKGLFPVPFANGVNPLMKGRSFHRVLVFGKLSSAEHPPTAVGTVVELVEGGDGDGIGGGLSGWVDGWMGG